MTRFKQTILKSFMLFGLSINLFAADHKPAYISIIIDDLGHNYEIGEQAIRLPAPITYAILPHSKHARKIAISAHNAGKEVMVHLPMQDIGDQPIGPGGLSNKLSKTEFRSAISDAIVRVPYAKGINNHMGSALTQDTLSMVWLMEQTKEMGLFFIDSRTTHKTVAQKVARQKQLLTAKRDIFLDNERSAYAIDQQFRKLVKLAKDRGTAIGIGHPHPQTLRYLEQAIPLLESDAVQIIPASSMVALQRLREVQLTSR